MKFFIKNKNKEKIALLIERPKKIKGLVFLIHGVAGSKEEPHMLSMANGFFKNGIMTISIDARNGRGESQGRYEDPSLTKFLEDLETVTEWAKTQPFYIEPFYLAGMSLGASASTVYAARHPDKVKGLVSLSAPINTKLMRKTWSKEQFKDLLKTGEWRQNINSKNSLVLVINIIKYFKDFKKYDLLKEAKKITCPVLLIAGNKDIYTPHYQQEMLFNALKTKKDLIIINGAPHTIENEVQLKKLESIIFVWTKKNEIKPITKKGKKK